MAFGEFLRLWADRAGRGSVGGPGWAIGLGSLGLRPLRLGPAALAKWAWELRAFGPGPKLCEPGLIGLGHFGSGRCGPGSRWAWAPWAWALVGLAAVPLGLGRPRIGPVGLGKTIRLSFPECFGSVCTGRITNGQSSRREKSFLSLKCPSLELADGKSIGEEWRSALLRHMSEQSLSSDRARYCGT